MTGSERPSGTTSEKRRRLQPYWEGENSGNALEASNTLNYRAWGIPAVLSRGIPGNALRAFPGSFGNFSGISSGKSQPYWGCGPSITRCMCVSDMPLWLSIRSPKGSFGDGPDFGLGSEKTKERKKQKKNISRDCSRAAKRWCFKRGGFPIWTRPSFFCPFLSFL